MATTENNNTSAGSIEINLINESFNAHQSDIVIFQKNVASDYITQPIAWKVIRNLGLGEQHPFEFPLDVEVAAVDSNANITNMQSAEAGQLWNVAQNGGGVQLVQSQESFPSDKEFAVANDLPAGSVDVHAYRDKKLLGIRTALVPAQRTAFQFRSEFYIGLVDSIEEGSILSPTLLTNISTIISLTAVTKADLILKGGGVGVQAKAFEFVLVPKA